MQDPTIVRPVKPVDWYVLEGMKGETVVYSGGWLRAHLARVVDGDDFIVMELDFEGRVVLRATEWNRERLGFRQLEEELVEFKEEQATRNAR